jgi:hypothetical protein
MRAHRDSINIILALGGLLAILTIGGVARAATLVGATSSAALAKPAIPSSGAYLGAWVDPEGLPSLGGASEIQQLPRFNDQIGKKLAILHLYLQFTDSFPTTTLAAIEQNGSIPLVDWACVNVTQIAQGAYDAQITSYAQSFLSFGQPVFLRWYWEMNLNTTAHQPCRGFNRGAAYIAAWQHIWNIFQQVGATNVAFVWSPNAGGDGAPYYPGDAYVDWIAGDNYDRDHSGASSFKESFNAFYNQWVGRKPLMVAETGATAIDQYLYIQSIGKVVPRTYPQFKAVMYFDAPGMAPSNWSFDGNGIAAFKALADMPYFSYH